MTATKALVTGGTGFLGSALVRRLVKDGYRVRVFDNDSRGNVERLSDVIDEIEFLHGDIRAPEDVDRACSGMEQIYHLAAVNGTERFYTHPELVLDVGVRGMLNVLDGSIKHNVDEIFLASSSEVYQTPPSVPTDELVPLSIPDPLNPRYSYGGSKLVSELLLLNVGRNHFRRAVVFRPHNVYGPDMGNEHVIPQLAARIASLAQTYPRDLVVPIQGTGKETRAFVYIDDMIDGIMTLVHRGDHLNIYNVGTNAETAIESLAKQIGEFYGRNITVEPGPPQSGGTLRRCPDIRKIAQLGYSPKVSLEDGLMATLTWYDAYHSRRLVAS